MNYAVIFDIDGVLVDSYQPHFESWRMLAEEHGMEMTEEQFASTFGRTSREIIRHFWGDLSDAEIKAMDDHKEALYREIIRESFPAMDGARELIDELHAEGITLAVGSSGPPENVDLVLETFDPQGVIFAAKVTGADVTRGKPDPQAFQLAAAKLGIAPGRCAVVEDAVHGIEAAKAAGMVGIGLTGTTDAEPLRAAGADIVVESLHAITAVGVQALIDGE